MSDQNGRNGDQNRRNGNQDGRNGDGLPGKGKASTGSLRWKFR